MTVHTGRLDATGMRLAIVVARFNEVVTERLLRGAVDTLVRHGAVEDDIAVYWVPGSYEIPFIAQEVAAAGAVDAIICLGAVVRGETSHYEIVSGEAGRGVAGVAMEQRIPCALGIVTTETLEQAIDRAGGKQGNKGADAALAAVEMVSLASAIRRSGSARLPRSAESAG